MQECSKKASISVAFACCSTSSKIRHCPIQESSDYYHSQQCQLAEAKCNRYISNGSQMSGVSIPHCAVGRIIISYNDGPILEDCLWCMLYWSVLCYIPLPAAHKWFRSHYVSVVSQRTNILSLINFVCF